MKLNGMKLVNWRTHKLIDLSFEKINVITGRNGKGKTSIWEAIYYMLLGRNSRTDKRGAGATDLIKKGEGKAFIEADIEGVGKVTRTVPHTLQINDWIGGIKEQQQQLLDLLEITDPKLDVAVNSSIFTDMNSRDRKDFLFDLMGLEVTDANVRNEFVEWGKENGVREPEKLYDTYIAQKYQLKFKTQSDIDAAHSKLVDRRKDLKKEIKLYEANLAKTEANLPEGITIESEDSIRQKLDDAKAVERDLIRKRSEMDGRIKELTKIATAPTGEYNREGLNNEMQELQSCMSELLVEREQSRIEAEKLRGYLAKLKDWKGKCPVFENIDCQVTSSDIQNITKQLEPELDKIRKRIQEEDNREHTGRDMIRAVQDKLKAAQEAVTAAQKKTAAEEIEKIKAMYDPDTMAKELTVVEDRIKSGQDILTKILAEKSKIKDIEKHKKDLQSCEMELKVIETLCDGFGPSGLKSLVLRKVLNPVREQVKQRMMELSGGTIEMDIRIDDEDLNLYMITAGIEREYKLLSSSEQLRVRLIISDVVAKITGFKFLIIDDIDRLDKPNRTAFLGLLKAIKPEYDTIIALCTAEPGEISPDADIKVIDL